MCERSDMADTINAKLEQDLKDLERIMNAMEGVPAEEKKAVLAEEMAQIVRNDILRSYANNDGSELLQALHDKKYMGDEAVLMASMAQARIYLLKKYIG